MNAVKLGRVRRAASGPCPRCGTVWVSPERSRWRLGHPTIRAGLVTLGAVLVAVGVVTESRPVLGVALVVLAVAVAGYTARFRGHRGAR